MSTMVGTQFRSRAFATNARAVRSQRCHASLGNFGPPPPPEPDIVPDGKDAYDLADDGKPMWLKDLERDMHHDPQVKELLEGGSREPDEVRKRMQAYVASPSTIPPLHGENSNMQIAFRKYDPAQVYFWIELNTDPTEELVGMIDEVVGSWFIIGKLGGYNASNLQVHHAVDSATSGHVYDQEYRCDFKSYFHELGKIEVQENWLRFRVDMGTADELCLDILINALQGCNEEIVAIKQLIIGGQNEDWPIDDSLPAAELEISPMQTIAEAKEQQERKDQKEQDDYFDQEEAIQNLMDEIERDHPDKLPQIEELNEQLAQYEIDPIDITPNK